MVDFLKYGWPICADRSLIKSGVSRNHASANKFPDHVDNWLKKGLGKGTIMGPFPVEGITLEGEIFSPLASREKSTPGERRIIMDLSFPEGSSVNDAIDKDKFLGDEIKLRYPKVDNLVSIVLRKGRGCAMFKRDLKSAYRQLLRVDPGDVELLGFVWKDKKYFDLTQPMGLTPSAYCCQRTTKGVAFIYNKTDKNYELVNYLDDLASAESWSRAFQAFETLGSILRDLGIVEAQEKAEGPNVIMTFLGIQFNTLDLTLSIDENRVAELNNLLKEWTQKDKAYLKEFQSILGKLAFAATVVRSGRTFLCRAFAFMKVLSDKEKSKLPSEVRKDFIWWRDFLKDYNGISMMLNSVVEDADSTFASDACLKGCGAFYHLKQEFFHLKFPENILKEDRPIHQLEMLAIVVSVKLWGDYFAGKRIRIYCDNESCVYVINKGKSKDLFLVSCLREILFYGAKNNFTINAEHIAGVENRIPDYLSRWDLDFKYKELFLKEVPNGVEREIKPEWLELSNQW